MKTAEAERVRAALGFALFFGLVLTFASSIPLLPLLGSPYGFLVAGSVGAFPTFAFLARRIGAAKAAALAAAVALILGLGFMAIGLVIYLLGG